MTGLERVGHIRVSWGDCDPAGIVFYPRYYAWFDACTHAMLAGAGLGHAELRARHGVVGTPLVHAEADFAGPATYDEELTVTSRVTELGRSRFVVAHSVEVDGRPVCAGHEVRVWARPDPDAAHGLRAAAIPDAVRAVLEGE